MTQKSNIRWLPALIVTGLALVSLIYVWFGDADNRQSQVMITYLIVILTMLLLLIWLLFFSRMPWKTRLISLGGVLTPALIFGFLFQIEGVDGDLVPIISSRFATSGQTEGASMSVRTTIPEGEVAAMDYSQFLGNERNAKVAGVRLDTDWESSPPREVWRRPIGEGWASFATRGTQAVTMEQNGDNERVISLDLYTGEPHWIYEYEARYSTAVGGTGPRSTPTILDGKVYTSGGTGVLTCLDLTSGELVWQVDVLADNKASTNDWGNSCSPLIIDSLVFVTTGADNENAVAAYAISDGSKAWAADTANAGHSSPQYAVLNEVPQIVAFNAGWITGHTPQTGKTLWREPWSIQTQSVAQPVQLGKNRLFVSSGYGTGCKLYKFSNNAAGDWLIETLWETRRMKAKFTNVVLHNDYIYGLDDGVLVCLDPIDGERKWKKGRYGHGQIILVDDIILVQTEKGEVVLVEANPEKFNELARYAVIDGKTWNAPAFPAPYLLVRNNHEAVCLELPLTGVAGNIKG